MDSIGSHDDAVGQTGNSSAVQAEQTPPSSVLGHGVQTLPAVIVDTYNGELRDEEGVVGDRAVLVGSDTVAAGLVHTAIEEFAHELATVVRRFLRLEGWRGTERIVIGGGLSSSHLGHLAMGRAQVLLAEKALP